MHELQEGIIVQDLVVGASLGLRLRGMRDSLLASVCGNSAFRS